MSNQPAQIKTPVNLYTYNQVNSGFATVANTAQKKEKASLSSIFNWNKKDKNFRTEQQQSQQLSPTIYSTSFHHHQPTYTVQYAPNYIIDSNRKFMHYKPDGYLTQPFPSTIHATIRYLPNHKQRTNILTTNWEPSAYPTQLANAQPVTLQHEITYSEQITIAPSSCHPNHHSYPNQHHCLSTVAQNQSCKCYSNDKNYYLIPPNSSLLESSTKLHNKSTDCMLLSKRNAGKHDSIRGSKSHYNLNEKYLDDAQTGVKKKSTKFAATVNERFLRIFKKSIKEPFSTVKQRKSILDSELTAYDLMKESREDEEIIDNNQMNKCNLDTSLEDEDEVRNQFKDNFKQAKAKQKQHRYSPFKDKQVADQIKQNKENSNSLNKNKDDEDRWIKNDDGLYTSTFASSNLKTPKKHNQKTTTKFNSCRIAGQGMQLFNKRMSILDSNLSKDNLKEELSEEEDLNRFNRYAHNFEQLDKTERLNRLDKLNKLNRLDDNFRLFSKSSSINNLNNSIPNLPDPDYDEDDDDDEADRHTLTMFSRSTPDLDKTTSSIENDKRKKLTTFTNTTSLYDINSLDSFSNRQPPLPLPPPRQLSNAKSDSPKPIAPITNAQPSSPSSSTYSSFNSSINSNVKSILKKSNSSLVILEHLKTVDLIDKKRRKLTNDSLLKEEASKSRFSSTSKLLSTFKSSTIRNSNRPTIEELKPKKQVHFRSSFNDELIVEHINNENSNQELLNEEEEQIYDDILTTRFKQTSDNQEEASSEEEERDKKEKIDEIKNNNEFESKNFLKFDKNLDNLNNLDSLDKLNKKDYSSQSPENSIKSDSERLGLQAKKEKIKEETTKVLSSTGMLNSINKEKSSVWENQSNQLSKRTSSFEFKDSKDNNNQFFNTNKDTNRLKNGLDELQSTALVKQNRKQTDNGGCFDRQQDNNNQFSTDNNKNYNLMESLTQETNLSSINNSNLNSFKENNSLFNHNQDKNDNQQMSPSSSTSAYVSLYASSSFSSTGSSSSNYSTGFNSNENSSLSSNKISRSAILDTLNNRTNRYLDKSNKRLEQDKQNKNEGKENKIVIDVSMNGNYDSLNQSQTNEHIYEELEGCRFEREINVIDNLNNNLNSVKKSIFEGASRDQILEYLEDAKERIQELLINNYNEQYSSQQSKFSSLSTSCHNIASINRANRRNRVSNLSSDSSSSSDILITNINNSIGQQLERNDSGVGTETSKPSSLDIRMSKSEACLTDLIDNHLVNHHHYDDHLDDNEEEEVIINKKRLHKSTNLNTEEQLCADCDQNVMLELNEQTGLVFYPLLCSKCDKRRLERKEIIQEFVDTEFKYGRDLRIIREEFFKPIEIAGLLTKDQLKNVFLNLDELIEVNSKFSEKLQDAIDIATEQGDEDYTTVDIGKLFMESCDMIKSFETYCVKQATASRLLGQLEKDKEFLRIFLRVSQMENQLLRRMNLSAFLMVPVQRVCRYPLLLNRLFKVTPYHHNDRDVLREAQIKVEMHLEQINQQTKGSTVPNKLWRRISNLSNNSTSKRSNLDDFGDIKLKKTNSSFLELFKAFKSRS